MISLILLIATMIISKTKKLRHVISPKVIKIVIIIEIIGIVATVGELLTSQILFDNSIDRPSVGEADTTEDLIYESDGDKRNITIEVPATSHSQEVKEEYIQYAITEIDDSFLGDNEDLDSVSLPVVMKEEYVEGNVKAEWQLSNYKLIGAEGEINYDNVTSDTIVDATVTLTCEDMTDVYGFTFQVVPIDTNSSQGIEYYLKKMLSQLFQDNRSSVELPDKVGDTDIKWSRKYTFLGTKIGILGLVGALAMIVGQSQEEKKKKKAYRRKLERDYPKIVESLSLYVGAGLSVKNAMYRISEEYLHRGVSEDEPGFLGVLTICRKMEEGRSETQAYEELPTYCPTKEYRRLSSLLVNNLRRGAKGMLDQLGREEEEAFDMQRQFVKMEGEEASTKLLFPMIGLLGIVLVIIIGPSIFNMQMFN